MLQIFWGPNQHAICRALLSSVCQAAREGVTGQIVVVPEQFSHEAERMLCEMGGDQICLSAEVLSFTRLADRVSSLYGGASRKTIDQGGRLIAMAKALEAVASRLKLYGVGRKKPAFLLQLLEVVEELKGACIGPGQLRKGASVLEGQLSLKLEELALIQESFETACQTMGQDPNDRMAQLHRQLETSSYAANRRIYLFGFTDFTGLELDILLELMEKAELLTVGILGNGASSQAPFTICEQTVRQLRSCAASAGVHTAVDQLPAGQEREAALAFLTDHLFSGTLRTWETPTDTVQLHHSEGVYKACLDVADHVQQLAMSGYRYREIAVCCTQPEWCLPILEGLFQKFQIPFYSAGTEAVENNPVIGMLIAALEAVSGGLELEEVLCFLKCGLSPITKADSDRIELYARTWNIRGKKWEQVWDMHPDGYGAAMDEAACQSLEQLNKIRAAGVGPLQTLRDRLQAASNTGEQVSAFYAFLEQISLAETLQSLQDSCQTEQDFQRAQEYGQMYETVISGLEQLYRILGDTTRSAEDFAQMVTVILSQYTVGTIPANLDSVNLGGLSAMRFGHCRALFFLGAEEGAFPAYQSESSLLSEQERKRLLELGMGILPGRSFQLDREFVCIYQVLTSCTEQIYINTCTEQPSYLFDRITRLFPQNSLELDAAIPEILCSRPQTFGELMTGCHADTARRVLAHLNSSEADAAYQTIAAKASHSMGHLREQGVHGLYGQTLSLSASRVDQYAMCRCAYFLKYGLRLKAPKEAAFDAPVYGTFVHAILEETTRQVQQEGGFHAVSPERLEAIAREKMEAYRDDTLELMLNRSPRLSYLFRRNFDEVLAVVRELGQELQNSDFEPAGFEVEFSKTGVMPPVEIEGMRARAELSGFVDRVDLFQEAGKTYVRVIDYKTGKKSFDYTDVLNGIGLQMLIYLFALEEHGGAVYGKRLSPAGILYVPARRVLLPSTSKLTAEAAELKRQTDRVRMGLLVDNDMVLQAMEHGEGSPVFLPYKYTAKGERIGDLVSESDLELLRQHLSNTLSRMADEMAGGEVGPNPIVRGSEKTACTYCDYAEVCHLASGEIPARLMRKTDRENFWNLLREECRHG